MKLARRAIAVLGLILVFVPAIRIGPTAGAALGNGVTVGAMLTSALHAWSGFPSAVLAWWPRLR